MELYAENDPDIADRNLFWTRLRLMIDNGIEIGKVVDSLHVLCGMDYDMNCNQRNQGCCSSYPTVKHSSHNKSSSHIE